MISESQLREMLKAWIREYGMGGLPHERTANFLQSLIDHKGFVPSKIGYRTVQLGTIGDKVEQAIQAMASTPGNPGDENILFKAATVLRAYYLTPKHWPEEDRIRKLKAAGLPMSRHTYYRLVQIGRAFLLGYLVPERNMEESVA